MHFKLKVDEHEIKSHKNKITHFEKLAFLCQRKNIDQCILENEKKVKECSERELWLFIEECQLKW